MTRIWFNHWFSTAYHLIQLMRDGTDEPLCIIGSNRNEHAIYRRACEEWHTEPEIRSDEEYVSFCLEFCKQHKVDIFVPRHRITAIAKQVDSFKEIGVLVLCGRNAELMQILDSKQETYAFFAEHGLADCIPEYLSTHSFPEFCTAYETLHSKGFRVCYKLAEDEGALTFRVIDNNLEQLSALYSKPNTKVTLSAAKSILQDYDFSVPMLVMPYLDGPEISVDCLRTSRGNIVIPRYKTNTRYSVVRFDAQIMSLSNRILDILDLNAPLNLQFRLHQGKTFLLEINPRMSGGLQLSCLATGINLPAIALQQLLGKEMPWNYPDLKEQRVAHIETPICLS